MRTASWTDAVSVLDRVTAVFDAFDGQDEGLGVSELARRANLPKSTVSRVAAELVGQRLLDRHGDKLYLGFRLFELGQTVERPRRLRQVAIPVMTELRNLTGATVRLAVREGTDVIVVAVVPGGDEPARAPRTGDRLPAASTALGRVMIAFASSETAPAPDLVEVRRRGVAVAVDEGGSGRTSLAAAVPGTGASAVAAVSVTGGGDAVDPDRLGPAVRATARTLGARIAGTR